MAGAGNSTRPHSYQFTHYNPINGTNYYRLKQEDFSGDFDYSPIVAIEFKKGTKQLSVYPTLASEYLNYYIENGSGNANLEIVNSNGQVLLQQEVEASSEHKLLDISRLSSGNYWIILKTDLEFLAPVPFFKE